MADDDDIRIGNPERERAVSLLNDAFASGYLEMVEFEERSGAAYAAKTRAELRATLEDLPAAGHLVFEGTAGVAAASATSQVPGATVPATPTVVVDAGWESVKRKGVWPVPVDMLVTGSMGTVNLSYANASFPAPTVRLQLQMSASSVKIRLGPDQEIRLTELEASGWSTVKDKAGPPLRPTNQVIVVAGSVSSMSGVVVKRG